MEDYDVRGNTVTPTCLSRKETGEKQLVIACQSIAM